MAGIKFYLNPHICERKPNTPAYPFWSCVNEFSLILTHLPFLKKMCGDLKKEREMRSQLAPEKTKVNKEFHLDRPEQVGLAAPSCTSHECARIFIQVRPEFSQLGPSAGLALSQSLLVVISVYQIPGTSTPPPSPPLTPASHIPTTSKFYPFSF